MLTEQELAGLDRADLIRIYQEQFRHLRHVDTVDYGLFLFTFLAALVLILADGVRVAEGQGLFPNAFLPLLVLALAMGGGHILVYNAGAVWRRYVVLTKVETALGLYQLGVVPAVLRFFAPQSFWGFVGRLVLTHRGPFLLVYWLIGVYASFELGQFWFPPLRWPQLFMALLFPGLLLFLLLMVNYGAIRALLLSSRREVEAGQAATRADRADGFVAVGESLMHLDPPRTGDALRQFQKALELVPDHLEARRWVEWLQAGHGMR